MRFETPKSAILTQMGSGEATRTFCWIVSVILARRGRASGLRLEIAVRDVHFVECGEAFQKLAGDFSDVTGGAGTGFFDVVAQVAVRNVFHGDEDAVGVLVPAKELDEEILAL